MPTSINEADVVAAIKRLSTATPVIPIMLQETTHLCNHAEDVKDVEVEFGHALCHDPSFIKYLADFTRLSRWMLVSGNGSYEGILASAIAIGLIVGAQLGVAPPSTPSPTPNVLVN
jgi:hypothetical protein